VSDAVAGMRTYLLTQSDVTNTTSRIYFSNLPQGVTLPAVVLEQSGDEIVRHLSNTTTLRRTTINVIAYASTHTVAASLGDVLTTAIEFDTGTWGSVSVRRAYVEGTVDLVEPPIDGSEDFRHVRSLLSVVWHT